MKNISNEDIVFIAMLANTAMGEKSAADLKTLFNVSEKELFRIDEIIGQIINRKNTNEDMELSIDSAMPLILDAFLGCEVRVTTSQWQNNGKEPVTSILIKVDGDYILEEEFLTVRFRPGDVKKMIDLDFAEPYLTIVL